MENVYSRYIDHMLAKYNLFYTFNSYLKKVTVCKCKIFPYNEVRISNWVQQVVGEKEKPDANRFTRSQN